MKHTMFLVLLLLAASSAWPQASNSTVRGTVTDQGQAIIPKAEVTLTNTATNVTRSTVTNEAGLYVFPGVTPGPYRISAEFAGMQKFEGNLTVQVQQDPVVDIILQVGGTSTTVQVQDVTPMVRMDSPSLGMSLERQRIEQLPVNGRGYQNLLVTVPGVQWSSHGHGIGGRVQGNGMRTGTNILLVDGAPQNEVWEGWDVARQPSLDALEELRVEVNNASAKFSRPTSVIMSTRAGTNALHGNLFYTNRNSAYGVARRREDFYNKAPYVNRNEYGISLGGPVIIPKLYNGRNRTFFFWNWEATKFLTYTTTRMSVPTQEMRNGDFRGLVDAQGRRYNLYDPFTTTSDWQRQPLSYQGVPNTIDPARISPVAKFLFDHTRLPTHPNINPLVDANFIGVYRRPLDQDTRNIRVDHRFSDKDLIYARYSWNQHFEIYGSTAAPFTPINDFSTINQTTRWWPNHSLSTTWIHTFSPSLTNEVLVSGLRDWHYRGAGEQINYAGQLNLPNPFGAVNWPTFDGIGLGDDNEYAIGGEQPFYLISNFLTFQDNATKIKGKHEFQFGFQFRFEDIPKSIVSAAGGFSSATQATSLYDPSSTPQNPIAQPFTGHGLANMFLGVMNYNTTFRRPWSFLRRQEYAPYFQDNWKVTQRLSLNLGIRYEFRTPLHDKNDLLTSFDFDRKAYVLGTDLNTFERLQATTPSILRALNNFGGRTITYEEAGLPKHLVNNNWKQFGPRLGFAYRMFDDSKAMVLRGGYRLSYYTQPITNWFNSQNNQQIVSGSFTSSVTNTALSPDQLPNYGLRTVPQYIAGVNTGNNSIINIDETRTIARGFGAVRINPDLKDPKIHDWNLTIEKEVMNNTVVRVAYVGNYSDNIQQTINYNDSTPAYIWYATRRTPLPTGEFSSVATRPFDQQVYGNVTDLASTGYSRWNGFQFEFERRYSKGIGFQAFYITGNTLAATNAVGSSNTFLPGSVPQDFDELNRFLNYQRDTTTPQHQVRWNWIADLPFGRGQKFASNAKGIMEKIIGGWQIAGTGNWRSNHWTLPTSIFPNGNPIELYGEKYPVEDCTSGTCFPGYLYWNGYIPQNRINSVDANGKPNGIMGVPAEYKPAGQPLIPWGSTQLPPNAPANTNLQSFWDTNTVWLPLNNNTVQRTTFDNGLHPWRNQYMRGPNQWFMDASLFKSANISEKLAVRFTIDFFNVFNNPNNPTGVSSNGLLNTRNSGSPARVTQLSLRFNW
jgi:hypothetical protein